MECLVEHNIREKDRREKDEKKRKGAADHPGLERYDDPDDMWAEAERAEAEKRSQA